jgi:hypothetical protein
MKVTYGMVKADVAKVTNLNATDDRVKSYVNRALERLLYEAKWVDTTARYTICTSDNCLTWPREIETIEAVAICNTPGVVRNGWYEFLDSGPGISGGSNCSTNCGPDLTLEDRGNAVAFDDVSGTGKKIAVSCDGAESAGLKILLRYYDSTGAKVYTNSGGTIIEGEYVSLPVSPSYALASRAALPFGLYEVIKPVTNYPVRLWEYSIATTLYRALAFYEPDEILPNYRRSYIPQLGSNSGSGACTTSKVTVVGKRRFVPVVNDNSVLIIPHADAIRLGAQAIKREEDGMIEEAQPFWMAAKQCLDRQLHHWMGDGAVAPIRIIGSEAYGAGVYNMI